MTDSLTVRVLLFAGLRERTGQDELTVDLPPAQNRIQDLIEQLCARWPFLGDYPLAISRNFEVVDREAGLEDGDEVALLPPVSGGMA